LTPFRAERVLLRLDAPFRDAVLPAWLNLAENPSIGSGGTCFGDSGGPHFLGGVESNLEVALTVTGDAVCRAVVASCACPDDPEVLVLFWS